MPNSTLALLGGPKTIRKKDSHYEWPRIIQTTQNRVLKQLNKSISIYDKSGIIDKFEKKFAQYHKRKYALLTSSGTAALHSIYVGANLQSGDEIICPAYTFFATVTPLFFTGAIPVLCDADKSGNIDPNKIEKLINHRTRGIVVTHMWGIPCEMDKISSLCKKHNLLLFEDCSHAHGAQYKGKLVGTWGNASAWSLQGQKIISGGEGGILLTDSEEIYYRALLLGHYNKRCKQEIPKEHPLYQYTVTGMGLKYRAHPLAIAIASEQMSHLDRWLSQKRILSKIMIKRLERLPGIHCPKIPKYSKPAWYAFTFQYEQRELGGLPIEGFYEAIKAEGCIEADRPGSTCPLNLLPLFQDPSKLFPSYNGKVKYQPGDFPVAERFFENLIKLPVWVHKSDVKLVNKYMDAIEKVITNYRELL